MGRCAVKAGCAAVLLMAACALPAAGSAGGALELWRETADKVRLLAENDTLRAHAQALLLQQRLPANATPADQARALNVLARTETYLGLTAQAGTDARAALALATRVGDRVGQAEADLTIALNAVNEGDIDAVVTASTQGVAVLDGVPRPDLLSEALLRMATMYHRLGKVEETVTITMQSMDIARVSKVPLALAYAHQGMGFSLGLSERWLEARGHYQQMRVEARAAHSRLLEVYALNGQALVESKLGNAAAAEALTREAIALGRAVGVPFTVVHTLYALATQYREQGRHAEALPLFTEVVDTYDRYQNRIGLWYALGARSAVHEALGNPAAAMADAERVYALAGQIGLANYRSDSARRVAALLAARGEHRRAYALSLEAATLTAEAERKKVSTRVVELSRRYQAESKQREIKELLERNEQQRTQLQQRALEERWLWTVLLGSVAVLAVAAYFLLRLRRSHRVIRGLNASLELRVQARTAELRQQTRYLRTLIDALPWWVWLKDTDSRYLAVNQAAADTCGLRADELVGKTDADVRPPALATIFRADDLGVMQARRGKTVEEPQVRADGVQIWMETYKAPVLDEDGTVLGTVGFARDISERRAAEAARAAALAEAQRLARVRSEFLAQMSHELRTPLNGILGYAQILRRDRALHERQRAGVKVIEQSGEHLLTLINDVLDLAKIEAGKLSLHPADVAFDQILYPVAEIIRIKAERKALEFVCEIAPDLPPAIRADERRLRQVLLNLLSNAVKFTDRGQVTLAVRHAPGQRLRFEVRDTGAGIGVDQVEKIFRPFEHAVQARHRANGTGLGLAITRQFVRLMGGDIHVESAIGQGSVFWFELALPAARAALPRRAAAQTVTGYGGRRRTILIVDDMAAHRTMLAQLLGELGFTVVEAAGGAAALDQVRLRQPDLILMDIVMPDMDGVGATRRLRDLPGPKVPIIAMSATVLGRDEERYLAAGMNAFLPKPIDHDSLLGHIAHLLGIELCVDGPAPAPAPDAVAVLPPPAQIAALHRLARLGNMQDILHWAGEVEQMDARYRPFADQLRTMARGYQSKAILHFARRHLDEPFLD